MERRATARLLGSDWLGSVTAKDTTKDRLQKLNCLKHCFRSDNEKLFCFFFEYAIFETNWGLSLHSLKTTDLKKNIIIQLKFTESTKFTDFQGFQ